MTNIAQNGLSWIAKAGDAVDKWRYQEKLHGGEDCNGYNLYKDTMTGKYWLGTEDNQRQVWLTDKHKVGLAILNKDVKDLIPNYLLPNAEPIGTDTHHRGVRDLSTIEHTISDTSFLAHDDGGTHQMHIVGVNLPEGNAGHGFVIV
ncbi:hypothetical protein [Chelatococcus asaccharovorans]|uniref:Uncharacterized protein n=1 Tax=Chelatococcus asaccharovorans TaxID=28210 RepID=A0A2V3TQ14_9HYPH|nr:hypothetical protein [Chelatococcus asaccharovorans]MBS7703147.1 hypothetical protein [Chelatococcus asaccharovorans]PXW49987.1 hypothetical protein C7450_1352 [Chelatococcus asaccharovorans]